MKVKKNITIDGINLTIKIRSSMTSTITRQALNKKREQGYKLGRVILDLRIKDTYGKVRKRK